MDRYIQPELTDSIDLMGWASYQCSKTIGELYALVQGQGYNSFMLMYGSTTRYYYVLMFNINDTLYLGDNTLESSDSFWYTFFSANLSTTFSNGTAKALSSDGSEFASYNYTVTLSYDDVTINNVQYKRLKVSKDYIPYIFYTGYSGDIYINGTLPDRNRSGGAGSGYIGNSLLSNKKMVGYNVPTSSAESTKTESVNTYSANAEENKPKAGNGFARIKFLRAVTDFVLIDSYNNYHSPIVDLSNTGFKDGNQTTRWQYLQDGTFESYDNTQAQTKCVFNTKMKKGSAVNLCIECTTENIAAYPDFGFGLLSSMPTEWGYPTGGNRGTVLKWLYDFANTTKGTYKMSLSDIGADAEFYLCFYNNSTENIVYKVWFEGIPIFVS